MYRSKAIPGWHVIDTKMIHTDSLMEANIISELVRYGYSQKWRRTRRGIAFGYARYTPDVELCIYHQGHSVRAIVELKAFCFILKKQSNGMAFFRILKLCVSFRPNLDF